MRTAVKPAAAKVSKAAKPRTQAKKPRPAAAKNVAAAKPADAPRSTLRGTLRREAMLVAARTVFLEEGYAAASIDEIVRRTGGSKASLYSYFGSKEGLFEALVETGCDEFLRNVAIPTRIEGNLQDTLTAFGLRFFALFSDPKRVQLMRTIMAEATRAPHLAIKFYESGPKRARQHLSAFFQHCHQQGLLRVPDPDFAAIQFITLVKGHCQFRSLLGFSPLALDMTPEAFMAETVQLFLHGRAATPARSRKRS